MDKCTHGHVTTFMTSIHFAPVLLLRVECLSAASFVIWDFRASLAPTSRVFWIVFLLHLFRDSSIAVGSRDSEHSSSTSEGSTGSSRYRRAWWEAGLRWLWTAPLTSLWEETRRWTQTDIQMGECLVPSLRVFLTINDEFDFFVRVSWGVSCSIDGAEVHPVVPPHHLTDHQVCFCAHKTTYPQIKKSRKLSSQMGWASSTYCFGWWSFARGTLVLVSARCFLFSGSPCALSADDLDSRSMGPVLTAVQTGTLQNQRWFSLKW